MKVRKNPAARKPSKSSPPEGRPVGRRWGESRPAEAAADRASESAAVPKKKVFVVDDHPLVRERLAELIAQEGDLEVCGEAEDAITALKAIEARPPDIAVVDITLKDTYGIELIKNLKERCPGVPVLVMSMHDEALYGERAIRAGAKGYLNKQEATKKVIPAIRTILAGQMFVSVKTVEAHREHIKQKMGFKSSSELLRFAFEYLLKKG